MDGDGESYSDDAGTGIVCAPRHGKSIVLALQRSGWVTPDVCATRARGLVQSRTRPANELDGYLSGPPVPCVPYGSNLLRAHGRAHCALSPTQRAGHYSQPLSVSC
jgi:hypothetical protein